MTDPIRILYLDDEKNNLILFKTNFKRYFEVNTFEFAEEALKDIQNSESHYQIIITDMKMPVMSGVEFIEHARKISPDSKFFVITGYAHEPGLQEAIDNKIVEQLFVKPFITQEVLQAINDILSEGKATS